MFEIAVGPSVPGAFLRADSEQLRTDTFIQTVHFHGAVFDVHSEVFELTPRETQAIILGAVGLSVAQTAKLCYLDANTVKDHRGNAYAKLGLNDIEQVVSASFQNGLFVTKNSAPDIPVARRRLQVIRLRAQGYHNREIADILGTKESTVKHQTREAYGQLGVANACAAILLSNLADMYIPGKPVTKIAPRKRPPRRWVTVPSPRGPGNEQVLVPFDFRLPQPALVEMPA